MSAPQNPEIPTSTQNVGFKKTGSYAGATGSFLRFLDVSASRSREEARKTRFRIVSLIIAVAGAYAVKTQFRNTIALTNNQANVQDLDTYFYYRLMFGRARSRLAASIAGIEIPESWRKPIYSVYAKQFNAILDEARFDITSYPNLQAFFTRTQKDGVRPLPQGPIPATALTCPVDAELVTVGEVRGDRVVQIKGATYSLRVFLGVHPRRSASAEELEGKDETPAGQESVGSDGQTKKTKLVYCTLYLAPGDYHHFHSPVNMDMTVRRHFPGEVLPVKKSLASWFNDLFAVNERVVLSGDWAGGKMHYAAVAAYNVGDIAIHSDPALKTNRVRTVPHAAGGDSFTRIYSDPLSLKRGEDVGVFKLGSTIVMCFEAPLDWEFAVPEGSKVKLNQILGGTPADLAILKANGNTLPAEKISNAQGVPAKAL